MTEKSKEQQEQDQKKFERLLKEHGFELYVSGCGCCGSPTVIASYKGEELINGDNIYIKTE